MSAALLALKPEERDGITTPREAFCEAWLESVIYIERQTGRTGLFGIYPDIATRLDNVKSHRALPPAIGRIKSIINRITRKDATFLCLLVSFHNAKNAEALCKQRRQSIKLTDLTSLGPKQKTLYLRLLTNHTRWA